MSHTYRLIGYERGRSIYTRRERQIPKYHFYMKENTEFRRQFNRSKRMKMRQYFQKTREVLNIGNTNGWETW